MSNTRILTAEASGTMILKLGGPGTAESAEKAGFKPANIHPGKRLRSVHRSASGMM